MAEPIKKVYLDPGHGGRDSGAVGNGLQEKVLTLKIARYTRDYLLNNYENVKIRMSRDSDKYRSLPQRTNDANKWQADVLISVHINSRSAAASGYEDFIYNGPVSQSTHNLQDTIHNEMKKLLKDFPNRGKKRANFHMLRESNMPAVLPEFLFITNKFDASFLKTEAVLKEIGKSLAIGIAKHLKLKKKENDAEMKKEIEALKKEIAALKEELAKKADKLSDNQTPDPSHQDAWEWAEKEGLLNGENPRQPLTREQFATVLYRLSKELDENEL